MVSAAKQHFPCFFLEPTLMFKYHHSEDQGISFLLLPSLHFEIFLLRSPGLFRQIFAAQHLLSACSTTLTLSEPSLPLMHHFHHQPLHLFQP